MPNFFNIKNEQFQTLFPYYILLNNRFKIIAFGDTLNRGINGIKNSDFDQQFKIVNPAYKSIKIIANDLEKNKESYLIQPIKKSGYYFKGTFIYLDNKQLLFCGSQCISSSEYNSYKSTSHIDTKISNSVNQSIELNKNNKVSDDIHFKSLIENASDLIYSFAGNGKFTYTNPFAESILGYTKSEFLNLHFTDIIQKDYKKIVTKFYKEQTLEKKHSSYLEFPVVTKNGSLIWIGQQVQLHFNKKGDYEFTALARNITEIKNTQLLLEESHFVLSELVTNLHYGILLSDEKGKVILANQTFCDLFNLSLTPKQIIGKDLAQTANLVKHLFQKPDDFIKGIAKKIKENKLSLSEELLFSDGKIYERDYIPLFKNGINHAHLWQYSDVTQTKNATTFLKWNEEKYRSIIENMGLGIIEVDSNQKIIYVNNQFCKDSQYSSKELVGKNAPALLLPKDKENRNRMKEINSKREKGFSGAYEIQIKRKDGSLLWMLISGTPKYNSKKKYIGSIGIHLDISKQKNTEQELRDQREKAEQSRKAKEIFLANMSHEIRTPMNAIIGFSRLLKSVSLTDKQISYLDAIISSSENLLVIINDILDFSKIESGKLSIEKVPFQIETIIQKVIKQIELKSLEKNISIKIIYDPKIPKIIIGDPIRLGQILLNLINNSVKFTSEGRIKIICTASKLDSDNVDVSFKIADTGIGMKKEMLEKVFEDFIQGDDSITRKYGGTGLGLTISKQLIELMGGKISVESELGIGTIFTFTLSFKIGAEKKIKKKQASIIEEKNLSGVKILLAEDNEFNQMLALSILQSWGADVSVAKNGKEALVKVKKIKFDIILMDIQMPEMDGIQATENIRQKFKLNLPIIALTANALKEDKDKYIQYGINDYISKPFNTNELYQKIRDLIPKKMK
jgi:PAS domain S-box-containing protein